MKILDERETQNTTATTATTEKTDRSYSERVIIKWFCCEFKLGFLHLICNSFFIFKSNLELALSIILKQRELYEPKHVAMECRCLKIWDLLSFLICSSILLLKSSKNVATTTPSTIKIVY